MCGQPQAQQCLSFQESAPFAVIGSNTVVEAKGQRVRGRLYPWGIVEGKHSASGPGTEHRAGRDGQGQRWARTAGTAVGSSPLRSLDQLLTNCAAFGTWQGTR